MDTSNSSAANDFPPELMSRKNAANYLGYSSRALGSLGTLIPSVKVGSGFIYRKEDLDTFVNCHRSRQEVAEYLGYPTRWVAIMERSLPFIKVGRNFIYHVADLEKFIAQHMEPVTILVRRGKRI